MSCVVVDYGIGNVYSVMHGLRYCGVDPVLTGDHDRILEADRVILPGVGAFGRAKERLVADGLDEVVRAFVGTGRPFLGICVGMQLLMTRGTEFGEHEGLGIIAGSVDRVDIMAPTGEALRVPLIGWHPIAPEGDGWSGTPLEATEPGSAFYFVHSFAAIPEDPGAILATATHAGTPIVAALRRENVVGVQFHPERSGRQGLAVLDSFLAL